MRKVDSSTCGARVIPEDPVLAVSEALAASHRSPGYSVCRRCIMDSSHAEIDFDPNGVCNFCRGYEQNVGSRSLSPDAARMVLERALHDIRSRGSKREYHCILGISGGVDSSYLALRCKDWGIRPLLVQFDNGWNTELASNNIQALCDSLGFDLFTHVVDWSEFRDLQLAFLKAGVANVEAPSDHGIFACIYRTAVAKGIPYLLSGVNAATESNCPIGDKASKTFSYGYRYDDLVQIKAIHRRFGTRQLRTYPTLGYWRRYWWDRGGRVRRFDPLNFMPYNKAHAIRELQERTGWRPYVGKHFESVITRFHQSYILPVKFGLDKRRLHLSGLIWSGQISRSEAELEVASAPCPADLLRQDYQFVLKKLSLKDSDFRNIMGAIPKSYSEYPNRLWLYTLHRNTMLRLSALVRRLRG